MKAYSDEQKQKMIELYQSGLSIKQISDDYKLGKNSVNRVLQNAGLIPNRQRMFSEDTEQLLFDLYNKGYSSKMLSKRFNCSAGTLASIVKQYGGILKGPGSYQELFTLEELEKELADKNIVIRKYKAIAPEKRRRKGDHYLYRGYFYIQKGYKYIKIDPDDLYYCMVKRGGYVAEHRYIMAQHLGRPLTKDETVHHINGKKDDNDISNLQLMNSGTGHPRGFACKCTDCGSINIEFTPLD